MQRTLVLAACSAVVLAHQGPAVGQVGRMSVRDYLVYNAVADTTRAIAAAAAYANQKATLSQRVAQTRDAYWDEFPAGQNLEPARQAYSEALIQKDLFNGESLAVRLQLMDMQMGGGLGGEMAAAAKRQVAAFEKLTGGPIEPTHPMAKFEFEAWVQAFVDGKSRGKNNDDAFRDALPKYAAYAVVRDRADYAFNFATGPRVGDDPTNAVAGVLTMSKYLPADEVERMAGELVAVVDEPAALVPVTRRVADDLKKMRGDFIDYATRLDPPQAAGRMPARPAWATRVTSDTLLTNALAAEGGTTGALAMLRAATGRSWAECGKTIAAWVAQCGRERVLAAVKRASSDSANPGSAGAVISSICLELDVPVPTPIDADPWLAAYEAAAAKANPLFLRPAAEATFGALYGQVEEKMLLAAYYDMVGEIKKGNRRTHPMATLGNFALARGDDATFLAFIIYDDVRTARPADPNDILPQTAAAYAELIKSHDRKELLRATAAVRSLYVVGEPHGPTIAAVPNTGGASPLQRLRTQLLPPAQRVARANAAAKMAAKAVTDARDARSFAIAGKDGKSLESFKAAVANIKGLNLSGTDPSEIGKRLTHYVDTGDPDSLAVSYNLLQLADVMTTNVVQNKKMMLEQRRKTRATREDIIKLEQDVENVSRFREELERMTTAVAAEKARKL